MEVTIKKSTATNTLDRLVWFLFTIWLVIDNITGFFINSGRSLPISQFFKLFILLLLVYRLSLYQKQFTILYCILVYISSYILHLIFIDESIPISLLHLSKLLLSIIIYMYFTKYSKICDDSVFIKKANTILYVSFIIISVNIGIGIFGIGYHTYPDEKIGYKGFFFAGNEIGGLSVVIFPYILYRVYEKYNWSKYILTSLACVSLSILLGTKTVILTSIISSVCIALIYGNKKFRISFLLSTILFLIISVPFIIELIESRELDIFMRMSYSYEKGGIASLIFSSRDEFWAKKSIEFFDAGFFTQLLGLGGNRTVEMDHLDALLNYGYLGIITIYGFFFYLLFHAISNRKNNNYCPVIILTDVLLISISLVAGHIIFSSMAGLYIALQNSLTNIKTDKPLLI